MTDTEWLKDKLVLAIMLWLVAYDRAPEDHHAVTDIRRDLECTTDEAWELVRAIERRWPNAITKTDLWRPS